MKYALCSLNYFIIIRGNGPTIRSYESRANGPDSGTIDILGPFFFEFSKVNFLKINLKKIFLIYASLNNIRIFQRLFLIYAPVNHIGILQRQFDGRSCFRSAQNLTKRIFLIKNRYFTFILIEMLLNVLSLSDYQTVGLSGCWIIIGLTPFNMGFVN
jgi:hypothetical protein